MWWHAIPLKIQVSIIKNHIPSSNWIYQFLPIDYFTEQNQVDNLLLYLKRYSSYEELKTKREKDYFNRRIAYQTLPIAIYGAYNRIIKELYENHPYQESKY
jgi:hypothetical protein